MSREEPFSLANISFYFDQQRKDAVDHGMLASRSTQILHLRDRLQQLSPQDFREAISAMQKIVSAYLPEPRSDLGEKKEAGIALYETSQSGYGGAAEGVVDRIS